MELEATRRPENVLVWLEELLSEETISNPIIEQRDDSSSTQDKKNGLITLIVTVIIGILGILATLFSPFGPQLYEQLFNNDNDQSSPSQPNPTGQE